MNGFKSAVIWFLLVAVLTSNCGNPDKIVGTGSESSNAFVKGVAVERYVSCCGSKDLYLQASEMNVILYEIIEDSTGFSWDVVTSVTTDNSGGFIIDSINPGNYSLILEKGQLKGFSGYFEYTLADTPLILDTLFVGAIQKINGTIKDSSGNFADNVVLGLIGTPYDDTVGLNGAFVFNDVPLGDYKMEIATIPVQVDTTISGTVAAPPSYNLISVNSYFSPSIGAAVPDTSYIVDYNDTTARGSEIFVEDQTDTVKVMNSSVEVVNDKYSIQYTVE